MARRTRTVVMALMTAALTAGCGGEAEEDAASTTASVAADQTIEVNMVDIAFKPDVLTVKAGTTVRFVFANDGNLVHDATFGDEAHQQAVESGRQQRDGVAVGPNKRRDFIRTFNTPGTLIIGCHQAGHYEAGMKIRLTIQ